MKVNIFRDNRFSLLWLVVRAWVGLQWLEAGWHKLNDPKWMAGESIRGFWMRAAGLLPDTKPLIKYGWYESFITWLAQSGQNVWFGKLIAFGEFLVGLGLIVGGLTIAAAFFGALMNMSFMLAGTTSSNPVLYTCAILIILAGPTAYYWGIDRFLLPRIYALLGRKGAADKAAPARAA